MATPGDASCRPVADCGRAPWGNVRLELDTTYVDIGYSGGASDGSSEHPWTRIQDAIDAAPSGGLIAVAAGAYPEILDIQSKPVRIWGRCPDLVTIEGGTALPASIVVRTEASGTIVRGVAVTGPGVGIFVGGSEDVAFEEVWIHDTGQRGAAAEDPFGPTSVTFRRVLIEHTPRYGLSIEGVSVVVEDSVFRDVFPDANGGVARSLSVKKGPVALARGKLEVRGSVIEHSGELGIYVEGSDAIVDSTLVRDTTASAEGTGRAVSVQTSADELDAGYASIRASVLERSVDAAIFASGSDVTVEATVMRDVAANAAGHFGHALIVQDEGTRLGKATVSSSLAERSYDCAILAIGSELVVEGTLVRSVEPDTTFQTGGWGIGAQASEQSGLPAKLTVRASRIEDSHMVGIAVVGASALLERVHVLRTLALDGGDFGDGVAIVSLLGSASLDVVDSRFEANARAGLSTFGGAATVKNTEFDCNGLDLDGETESGHDFSLADLGGNECGCGAATRDCVVLSSNLAAPSAIE
jgi:hypothetical protein